MSHFKNPPIPFSLSDILLFLLFFQHFRTCFAVFSLFEKGSFKFLKLAVSFYSQIGHIFPIYYRRSQKDAPFYFPPEVISPSCLRHPFPKANFQIICKHRTYPSPYSMQNIEHEKALNNESLFSCKKRNCLLH